MASKHSADMEDILACPICLELLNAPKMLPCLHRFCTNCLDDTVKNCPSTKLQCPICRQVFALPPEGVGGMKGDFIMEAILENYKLAKELEQTKKERKCYSCDEVKTSEAFCPDCGGFLCKDCYEPHQTMKTLSTHDSVIRLEDLQTGNVSSSVDKLTAIKKAPKCSHHGDQILYLNCKTCNIFICPVCAAIPHKAHDIEEVKTAVSDALQQMEDFSENDEKLINRLQKVIDLTAQVETEADRCHNQIRLESSKVEAKINSDKDARIAKIEHEARKELENLECLKEDDINIVNGRKGTCLTALNAIKGKLEEVLKLIENTNRSIFLFSEKTDMWSTLRAVPDITTDLETLRRASDPPMPELDVIEAVASNLSKSLTFK